LEQKIQILHALIKEMFPDAVSVSVIVNCEGILVEPSFRTNLSGYSMMSICGKWIEKAK